VHCLQQKRPLSSSKTELHAGDVLTPTGSSKRFLILLLRQRSQWVLVSANNAAPLADVSGIAVAVGSYWPH